MASPIAEHTVPWPPEEAARYLAHGYWEGTSLGMHIWGRADVQPDVIALVDGELRLTYRALVEHADAAATRLAERGLTAGDRVVVQLPNCWELIVLTLALFRLGAVPVMALPAHRRHELTYLVTHSEAAAIAVPDTLRDFDHQSLAHDLATATPGLHHVLVTGDSLMEDSVDLRKLCGVSTDPPGDRKHWDEHPPDSRDVAVFLLSGGTTGLSKFIARTHDDYAYNAKTCAELCALDKNSVYLVSLPAGHNFPLACPGILGTFIVGGRVVLLASAEPERAVATIRTEGVTHTAVVPVVAQRWLVHQKANPSDAFESMKVLQVGGARLADEFARQVHPVLGATLQQVFGMAEGLINVTRLDDPEDVICETQGRPISPGDEVQIVDESDQPLGNGVAGSLLTRGPYTPRGYYKAAEQNERAFTADGWYRSGDIVRRRPDGNLVVEGREKDMINRGGEKISAEEVENLAYQLVDVSQAAAVAMVDPEVGERVCLFVVPRPGQRVTLKEVRDSMCGAGVAQYKWPERLEVIDVLPTTKVGKVDKHALREEVAVRLGEDGEGPVPTPDLARS